MTLFRQVAWKLRWRDKDGVRRFSARPRLPDSAQGAFQDVAPNPPTLIEIPETDLMDVNDLMKMGALIPWTPPETPKGGNST